MAKTSFTQIKKALASHDRDALIALLGELYALNQNNRDFLDARFREDGSGLTRYKKAIGEALYPNVMSRGPVRIRFREANKAISDYRKALGEPVGVAELLVFAAECGTEFTCDYGDQGGPFYASLTRLFEEAAEQVSALEPASAEPFIARLEKMVARGGDIGWGFGDSISMIFFQTFPDADET